MKFSCTKKIIDEIKKFKTIELEKEEPAWDNWYVDLIILNRKKYWLFTNSLTLFSFFIYGGTKKEKERFEAIFDEKLEEQVIRYIGVTAKYKDLFLPKNTPTKFMKTNSRSVLGTMNDLKYQIQARLDMDGISDENIEELNLTINQIPVGSRKYESPMELTKMEVNRRLKAL